MQETLHIQSAGQCYYFMAEGSPTTINKQLKLLHEACS